MAHPRMYDEDDPVLGRLRRICAALPGTVEKESWGRPTFRIPRIYAVYGSGADEEHAHALIFKPDDDERPALLADGRFWPPPYYGPGGWLAVDLTPTSDWAEVAELLATSYGLFAPAQAATALRDGGLDRVLAAARDDSPVGEDEGPPRATAS